VAPYSFFESNPPVSFDVTIYDRGSPTTPERSAQPNRRFETHLQQQI